MSDGTDSGATGYVDRAAGPVNVRQVVKFHGRNADNTGTRPCNLFEPGSRIGRT